MPRAGFRSAVGAMLLASAWTLACESHAAAEQDCIGLVAKRVEPHQKLTIILSDSAIVQGAYSASADSGIFVDIDNAADTFIATRTIRSIEFRDVTRPRLLYATVGFFAGGIAGGLIWKAMSDDDDDAGAVGAGLIGAGVGVLAGLTLPIDLRYARLVSCDSSP